MNTLNFETGLVTFSLNGKCELTFNPTDSAFVERLYNAFDTLDKKQDEYKDRIAKTDGGKEIFDIARAMDAEMRGIIDAALGTPVCEPLFGEMNVYSMADGLPVWCNLMMAIIDRVDVSFANEQKRTNPRLEKYTAKYSKYRK